jgi:hypothetical protein
MGTETNITLKNKFISVRGAKVHNLKSVILVIMYLFCLSLSKANPLERDAMTAYGELGLYYLLSDFYNYQLNLHVQLFGENGHFKNIYFDGLELTYAYRQVDNEPQHKFKFLFYNWQGIFPSVMGVNIKDRAIKTSEYLFSQFGAKLIEWNKLDYFESDLNFLNFNFNILYENRKYNPKSSLYGLDFLPGENNLYFVTDGHIGLTNIILNNRNINLTNSNLSNDIFGFEYGYNLELGYELNRIIDDSYFYENIKYESNYPEKSSICLNLDRRYIFGKALNTLDYGATLKISFLIKYLRIIMAYKNRTINYYHQQSNNNFFSIGISTQQK